MFSITPYKEIQDSLGFWIPRCGFRIPGTGFQFLSVELEFWIPIVSGIPDSLSCIPDSKDQESRFHQQKFSYSEILIPLHGVISIFFHYCLFWITWVTVLVYVIAWFVVISGIETILKYHEWYLYQISRTNHAIICLYYYPRKVCNFHM